MAVSSVTVNDVGIFSVGASFTGVMRMLGVAVPAEVPSEALIDRIRATVLSSAVV